MYKAIKLLFVVLLVKLAAGDIYLHNPRGSNNRWNENSRNRNNANRMFDSQNNNRGGYNVGSVYYYAGSTVQVEWTNQHSCGNQNSHCDVIIQYMCGEQVRDGTTTSTIPDNPAQCENLDCNEDRRYGMHEDFYQYAHCKLRTRNLNLFTADRNVDTSGKRTRQNQNGNRFGYECPEERDYYPYWGPTPWRDIAILTNDPSRCEMYKNESQNTNERFACKVSNTYLYQNSRNNPSDYIPITERQCEAFEYEENGETKHGVWQRYDSHGIAEPECSQSQWSRDNHLGNGVGGQTLSHNWTVPDDITSEHCVMRVRYNISTSDYDRDNTTAYQNSRNRNRQPGPDLWSRHGLTEEQGQSRGYYIRNNPQLNIFNLEKLQLQLAVDTSQYGRTFQDRSHTFAIRSRPADIPSSARIINVNVRGKRGNIVQVYPAVEYDFVPNTALVQTNDYVHMQWTGSDNNPNNNDGQGRAGTDRSNVVLLNSPAYVEGDPGTYKASTYGQLGSSYPSHLSNTTFAGFTSADLKSLAILKPNHFGGDMDELNDAGTYFDLGARQVTMTGTYHYMCTRNNNFSNRSQKGKLIVINSSYTQKRIDQNGGVIELQDTESRILTSAEIPPGALSSAQSFELWEISPDETPMTSLPSNRDFISSMILMLPHGQLTVDGTYIKVQIKLSDNINALYEPSLYRTDEQAAVWQEISIDKHADGVVAFSTDSGGYFVVSKSVAAGPMAGLVIGVVVAVVLVVGIIVILRKNKLILAGYKGKV